MTIVTVANHRPTQLYYCYDAFMESCRRLGHEPLILKENFGGIGTKPRMLKAAIEKGLIPDKHIIFTDAFDVVFQRNLEVMPDKIIFNAERNCFPDVRLADKHPESKTPYRYLNSGLSVGPTELYLQALNEMNAQEIKDDTRLADGSWDNPNDQDMWMKLYLFGNTPISLDTHCTLFQTLHDVPIDELDLSEPLIRNKITGSTPVGFHLNGKKETWRNKILSHLNLPL